MKQDLHEKYDVKVSSPTVRRVLTKHGLHGRVAKCVALLSEKNYGARLAWAYEHYDWKMEDWNQVLWTDESKFELFNSKRRKYVRMKANEAPTNETTQKTVKHGGGNVMIWGCFGNGQVGNIKRIQSTMDQHVYHSILTHHAIPSGRRIFGDGNWIFQQDNDPKHTSKKCSRYLENKVRTKKIKEVMDWPAQSPDLNPIELLWDEMDRSLKDFKPSNKDELYEKLVEVWRNVSAKTLEKLVARMPYLCLSVIVAEGGHFDEKYEPRRIKKLVKEGKFDWAKYNLDPVQYA